MRITRLHIRNVRRHTDLALDFAPGLNVVCGPNEAGKSTIQKAIEMGLFRSATSSAQELTDLRSWAAGPADDPQIEIDFDEDGTTGRLVKSFARSMGTVELELGEQTMTDPRQVDQTIAEITGLPSEKFYRSTAGVRHSEVATLDGEDGGLRDRLQKSMSGADRGTAQARKRLAEAIRQYRLEGPKNSGPLKAVRDEITRNRAELAKGEQELASLERDRAALASANTRRVDLDGRLATDEEQLARAEHVLVLQAQERDAQARYERLQRATVLRAEVVRLQAANPTDVPLPQLRDGIDRLRHMEFDISEVRAELAGEPDPMLQLVPVPKRWTLWAALGALAVIAAIAVAVVALVSGTIAIGLVAIPLVVVGVVLFLRGWRLRGHAADVRRSNELIEADVKRQLQGRSARQDRVRAAERERNTLLASLRVPDSVSAEKLLEAANEHTGAIERLQAEERGLLGDLHVEGEIEDLRDAAASEAAQAGHALAGMGADSPAAAADRVRLRAAVEATRRLRDAALGEEGQARGRVDANDVDAEVVARVSEALAAAEERQTVLARRLRVYETTLAAIEAAEQGTMQKAARFLEQHMGRDIAALTGGRYRRIQVDELTLAFRVFSPERGDWIPAGSLSRGTLDQLYLAARLGLVRQLTGDKLPPLILDDPFVTFDDARATHAVELLKRLAADYQVIFLTCSSRYNRLADRVIELPQPTARDSASRASTAEPGVAQANASSAPQPGLEPPAGVITRDAEPVAGSPSDGPSLWDAEPAT